MRKSTELGLAESRGTDEAHPLREDDGWRFRMVPGSRDIEVCGPRETTWVRYTAKDTFEHDLRRFLDRVEAMCSRERRRIRLERGALED